MKKKLIPFPGALLLLLIVFHALIGSDSAVVTELFIGVLFFAGWYAVGPDREMPSRSDWNYGSKLRWGGVRGAERDLEHRVNIWVWDGRMRGDRSYRSRWIAGCLALLLVGTALLCLFHRSVILWRAIVVMSVCAVGLLAILADLIIRKAKKISKK